MLLQQGGIKADHMGGVKVDQSNGRRLGIVGEEGVWSGGLRRLKGGAFRPERKTPSSPRRVVGADQEFGGEPRLRLLCFRR